MTTDLYSQRVLFNEGEGVDPSDFNELQRLQLRQLVDNLFGSLVPDAIDDPTSPGNTAELFDVELSRGLATSLLTPTDMVFTTNPGCGYWKASTNARELVLVPGTIAVLIDDLTAPTDTAFATFRLGDYGAAPTTLTTAAGDATNPRIDLVEVKLEYVDSDTESRDFEDAITGAKTTTTPDKRRRVQATVQVKQGTPAASPAYPAPSAGFVAMCAVWVPAAHNAVHSADNIRDLRMPLGGVRVYDVPANQFWFPGADPWTLVPGSPSPGLMAQGPGSGTGNFYAVCPVTSKKARLVGVGLYSRAGISATLVRVEHNLPASPTITDLAAIDDDYTVLSATGGLQTLSMVQVMHQLGKLTPTKGTRVTDTRIGSPMWCSGFAAGPARAITAFPDTPSSTLAVRVGGDASSFASFVRFVVAEGL